MNGVGLGFVTPPAKPQKASANVYVSAAGNTGLSGSGTWDAVVATFAADELNRFTHSAGVLTYTGPGERVIITASFVVNPNSNSTTCWAGIAAGSGDPDPGADDKVGPQAVASQARMYALTKVKTLATGDKVCIKYMEEGGVTPTWATAAGAFFSVHGEG